MVRKVRCLNAVPERYFLMIECNNDFISEAQPEAELEFER